MRYIFSGFSALARFDENDAGLSLAQFRAFSKQIPLLYFVLVSNTIALSFTHWSVAPRFMTLAIPAILYGVSIFRLLGWWRSRHKTVSLEDARRRLRTTIYLAVVLGGSFTAWALALYPYGDAFQKGHVAFYMANTVIGCIFCLMHMRAAALTLMAIVIVPFTVFFFSTGNVVFSAIAINMLLVSVAMILILIANYRDFSDLIQAQRELTLRQQQTQELSDENYRLANIDSLAGIPNRRYFFAELERRLEQAKAQGHSLAVGVIDLDGFKPINDAFGHMIGDRVLQVAANRLGRVAREGMFAARLGGDEFGIILSAGEDEETLEALGDEICDKIGQTIVFPGISVQVAGSLGFALFPGAGTRAQELFEKADYALYHAKQHRRGGTVIFSGDHARDLYEFSRIKHELHSPRWEEEMTVHFQPMIDSHTRKVLGFEALARWNSSTLGHIPPDIFISVAERTGIIHRVTELLFTKALAAAATWPEDVRLSFNLSARDVVSRPLIDRLRRILEESPFDPSRLEVEITETSMMRDFDIAQENLGILKDLGANVALDDFGTGYSSLSYLHRLAPDMVKIDRSFILDIEKETVSRDIVKSIVDLAHNVGCQCVVEGVETVGQVLILRSLGCRFMQGYHFSRPLPQAECLPFLETLRDDDSEAPALETVATVTPLRSFGNA